MIDTEQGSETLLSAATSIGCMVETFISRLQGVLSTLAVGDVWLTLTSIDALVVMMARCF